jgi:hypothetical protein
MFRAFVIALILSYFAAFAGAQAQPAPVAPATKPSVKKPATKSIAKPAGATENGPCRLGVIPVVGNQFVVQKIGFTMFGNERAEVPVDSWGLDDLVVARVRAAPGAAEAVRRIAYARDAFVRAEQPGSLFRNNKAELSGIVRQIATSSHCDRYVLVNSSASQFSNLNQSVRGVGIVNWGNPIKDHTYLFALTYIRIYDGQSFEVIKEGAVSTDEESLLSRALLLQPIRGPSRELDNTSFPSAPAEAASNPALRDGVRALLTASLDKTLPGMLGQKQGLSR